MMVHVKLMLIIFLLFISSCNSGTEHPISRQYFIPTIDVEIKGKIVHMILDTGGAITIIDDDLARELGINTLPLRKEIIGYGGSKEIYISDYRDIILGKSKMTADIYIMDMQYITNGEPIQGILGIDHLTSSNVTINLITNTISIE